MSISQSHIVGLTPPPLAVPFKYFLCRLYRKLGAGKTLSSDLCFIRLPTKRFGNVDGRGASSKNVSRTMPANNNATQVVPSGNGDSQRQQTSSNTTKSTNRIFIGNLPASTRIRDLQTVFAAYGAINDIVIRNYRFDSCIAFVAFERTQCAGDAVRSMSQQKFLGRSLILEFANEKRLKKRTAATTAAAATTRGSAISSSSKMPAGIFPNANWACKGCNNNNYGFRKLCNRCNRQRPAETAAAAAVQPAQKMQGHALAVAGSAKRSPGGANAAKQRRDSKRRKPSPAEVASNNNGSVATAVAATAGARAVPRSEYNKQAIECSSESKAAKHRSGTLLPKPNPHPTTPTTSALPTAAAAAAGGISAGAPLASSGSSSEPKGTGKKPGTLQSQVKRKQLLLPAAAAVMVNDNRSSSTLGHAHAVGAMPTTTTVIVLSTPAGSDACKETDAAGGTRHEFSKDEAALSFLGCTKQHYLRQKKKGGLCKGFSIEERELSDSYDTICHVCGGNEASEDFNVYVVCDCCENSYHQLCHTPAITADDLAADVWFCSETRCSRMKHLLAEKDATLTKAAALIQANEADADMKEAGYRKEVRELEEEVEDLQETLEQTNRFLTQKYEALQHKIPKLGFQVEEHNVAIDAFESYAHEVARLERQVVTMQQQHAKQVVAVEGRLRTEHDSDRSRMREEHAAIVVQLQRVNAESADRTTALETSYNQKLEILWKKYDGNDTASVV